MSWSDIIQSGFRTEKDFEQKGITNLEQLEIYILSKISFIPFFSLFFLNVLL